MWFSFPKKCSRRKCMFRSKIVNSTCERLELFVRQGRQADRQYRNGLNCIKFHMQMVAVVLVYAIRILNVYIENVLLVLFCKTSEGKEEKTKKKRNDDDNDESAFMWGKKTSLSLVLSIDRGEYCVELWRNHACSRQKLVCAMKSIYDSW